MNTNQPSPGTAVGPSAPTLTSTDLWKQFWADGYGKEVQTAATYSYTWLADQFGHVCIGILANYLATTVIGLATLWFGTHTTIQNGISIWWGFIVAVIGAAIWEWSAYNNSVKQAFTAFPLDTKLLRDNAFVATGYMALGALLGLAFHLDVRTAILISLGVVIVAILLAPRWLRQKIVWQKASIPYLFRLADVASKITPGAAETLQDLIKLGAPPKTEPSQVVIGGPIGSGRTSMAAGIGTEFAFKDNKVRYMSLNSLLEFAAGVKPPDFPDDPGPTTISYWPWCQAQVIIIDDVGPLIAAEEPQRKANLERFRAVLETDLKPIADVLGQCHTVWVVGDLVPPFEGGTLAATLDDFAKAVAKYCGNKNDPLAIELGPPPERTPAKGPMLGTTRNAHQAAVVRDVRHVARAL
jgi:hypothetical protein